MLTKEKILELFERLNTLLAQKGEVGEIGIVGGTAMCLVYDARNSTQDVDAIFKPTASIRKFVAQIAEEEHLAEDWLNDGAKGFLVGRFQKEEVLSLSHLRVWAPEPRYLLAMKCLSARWDSLDRKDVIFLTNQLHLKTPEAVFEIIENYFPKKQIPTKTQFFLEELFEQTHKRRKK